MDDTEPEINFQTWICPICIDDHLQLSECKVSDLKMRIRELSDWKAKVLKAVNAQAEDETLWCLEPSVGEAYVTQSLRWLHEVIEKGSETALKAILGQSTGDI